MSARVLVPQACTCMERACLQARAPAGPAAVLAPPAWLMLRSWCAAGWWWPCREPNSPPPPVELAARTAPRPASSRGLAGSTAPSTPWKQRGSMLVNETASVQRGEKGGVAACPLAPPADAMGRVTLCNQLGKHLLARSMSCKLSNAVRHKTFYENVRRDTSDDDDSPKETSFI